MTAKEYLNQYDNYRRKCNLFQAEYNYESEELFEIKKHLRSFPPKRRREVEESFGKCVIFCNGLKWRAEESADKMSEIEAMIESIPGIEGEILQLRYIDGLTWEDVCDRLFYSWFTIHKGHDEALKKVDEILENNQRQES